MKRFKTKRRLPRKLIRIFLVFIIISLLKFASDIRINVENQDLLNLFLDSSTTSYNLTNTRVYRAINDSIYSIFNSPDKILNQELMYEIKREEKEASSVNLLYEKNELPLVYIYNSHQGEQYSNKYLVDYSISPSVVTASYMLEEKLEDRNVPTLVEESNILEYMSINNLAHSESYVASRRFLLNVINTYPSIKLFIDLHRDSVDYSITNLNIGGKDYARIMFVVGLKYETYENNLETSIELNNMINERCPGLSRGILKKGNIGANGVYNQDLNKNIVLIELGGYQNNIDELNNTLDVLSEIIGEYVNEKEK